MNGLVKEGSIGAILFKSQIITEQELRAALEAQKVSGCRVGEALVRLGVVTQEDIDWALSNQLNIPYVRLKKENLDPAAIARVPGQLARRYNLFPVVLSGNELSVAMADPLNKEAIEELVRVTGCQVTISVGLIREIREMQDLIYPDQNAPELGFTSKQFPAKVIEAINADLSAAALLNHLLLKVIKQKLTTLALQPLGDDVVLVARGGGRSAEIGRLASANYHVLTARIRKLARMSPSEGISSNGVLTFMWQGKKIPFQALLMGASGSEYVTIKLKISPPPISELADLQLPSPEREALQTLTREKEGLILFSGREPDERCRLIDLFMDDCDSAGKTVLVLGERLGRGKKRFPRIPVKMHDVIDQTASIISAALEHDPDTLVVEDITDVAAFVAASRAVMRGKLVVAGICHPDKLSLLKQLLYLRQKNYLIPTHLKGLIISKCVLTLCPACKEKYQPAAEELAALRLPTGRREYFRPRGCTTCDHTGYRGRRYLLDVIRFDKTFLEAFEMIGKSSEIISFMKDNGYRGIAEEGIELLERGEISPGEYVASILL
ncbi:ATPase, T2SS/T4P/T4SS family [Geomonas sp.]|uniref:ATPase, T2SS/T4P/T4SS family n=1 Tax=Geomonas sp. TaxID=2651584 RepID=UPI002B48C772|nr:ATPase, T2SS/T4P/T4SS family [Geomonas sp.]HJV33569.1 ATPase, T2SS/T4P/T4SS family [Geomonas sp.]